MRWPALLVLVLVLGAVAHATPAHTPQHPIIGGTPATLNDYPNVIAIEVNGGLCSGTLIAPDWVLTAAHCVTPSVVGLKEQVEVTAGISVRILTVDAFADDGMTIGAVASMPDPLFDINHVGSHDAGLIKLVEPITLIAPATLNFVAGEAPVGIAVTMVGYGATGASNAGLIGVEFSSTQGSSPCGANGNDANLLCFGQVDGGQCGGDSGGPAFASIDGVQVEVALASFGDRNCTQFSADTRIDAESAFILEHIPELGCVDDESCAAGQECFARRCIARPDTATGVGWECESNDDCDSHQCAVGRGGAMCTMPCTVGADGECPSGFECVAGGDTGACWPDGDAPIVRSGGCTVGSGNAPPLALVLVVVLALAIRRRERATMRA